MSRCVSIVYRRVSETKHLYRDSDTCHRDRSTVQRDIRLCHRDRLSLRRETNRNFTMAVLYLCNFSNKYCLNQKQNYMEDVRVHFHVFHHFYKWKPFLGASCLLLQTTRPFQSGEPLHVILLMKRICSKFFPIQIDLE